MKRHNVLGDIVCGVGISGLEDLGELIVRSLQQGQNISLHLNWLLFTLLHTVCSNNSSTRIQNIVHV